MALPKCMCKECFPGSLIPIKLCPISRNDWSDIDEWMSRFGKHPGDSIAEFHRQQKSWTCRKETVAMREREEIEKMVDDLYEGSAREGTEVGEWWRWLADGYEVLLRNAESQLLNAYYGAVRRAHNHMKEDFKVVETTKTHTVTIRTLVHKDEA